LVVLFFALFWLVPLVVVVVAGALAGDCSFTEECTDAEAVGLLVAVIVVLFWALVAAPLTLILALAWMLSTAGQRARTHGRAEPAPSPAPTRAERVADVSVEAMPALVGAGHEQAELVTVEAPPAAPSSGLPEEYLWGLAGVLWVFVLVGIVIASGDDWGLAVAGFAAIVTIPLTAMLVARRVMRKLARRHRGGYRQPWNVDL
jgi:hypothetical protein